jgi:hypothetical protein
VSVQVTQTSMVALSPSFEIRCLGNSTYGAWAPPARTTVPSPASVVPTPIPSAVPTESVTPVPFPSKL